MAVPGERVKDGGVHVHGDEPMAGADQGRRQLTRQGERPGRRRFPRWEGQGSAIGRRKPTRPLAVAGLDSRCDFTMRHDAPRRDDAPLLTADVGDDRPHARPLGSVACQPAGVEQLKPRLVQRRGRVAHPADEREPVGQRRHSREQLREVKPGNAGRDGAERAAFVGGGVRLGVERIDVAGPADEVDEDAGRGLALRVGDGRNVRPCVARENTRRPNGGGGKEELASRRGAGVHWNCLFVGGWTDKAFGMRRCQGPSYLGPCAKQTDCRGKRAPPPGEPRPRSGRFTTTT